jgi:predicted dehydrogenase
MSHKTTRRDFVKQSAALGTAWWVGSQSVWSAEKERSPLEQLNFACIGVGGKGSSDTDSANKAGNVIALCDVDNRQLGKKGSRISKAERFNDYREMFEKLGDKIDAVTVSTPDHSHAPASVRAMKMGKHCFCQKPLTWSVYEARTMRELAAEMKVATQMGNQGTAHSGLREAVEVIRGGLIGDVHEVHIWTNRPIWPQGTGRPQEVQPVPDHVSWDLFLGPAQDRPYHSAYHPFKWRGWLDFGTGALGDMACHTANTAVMALDLFDPISVDVETSGIVENETYPKWSIIKTEFGSRVNPLGDKLVPTTMFWYDGGKIPSKEVMPSKEQLKGKKVSNSGSLMVGSKGTFYSPNDYGAEYSLFFKDQTTDVKNPEQTLPRLPGGAGDLNYTHFLEFAVACKGGPAAMSNFNYASRLTETMILGNIALRAGEKIEWDAKHMKVTNVQSANKFLTRDYRKGFEV